MGTSYFIYSHIAKQVNISGGSIINSAFIPPALRGTGIYSYVSKFNTDGVTICNMNCEFNDDILCIPSEPIITSTKSHSFEQDLKIYPNPTKDMVIIENLSKKNRIQNIVILDINGRFIKNEPNKKSLEKLSLNTSYLNSGIYLLKIEFSNQDFILKKLLVE